METKETDILNLFDFPIHHFPDRSIRWLLQDRENVRGLVEIVADELAAQIDFSRLTQLNTSFVSETLREQESDLIFRVPFHSESERDELIVYILIEHQSTVDVSMGFRVLAYMMQIWDVQRREWESEEVPKGEWRLRPILPIVFYTGSQRWNVPLSLRGLMEIPSVLSRFVPAFEILFLSVKETDVSDLTRSDHPFGWLLTVLQQEHSDIETLRSALQQAITHLSKLDAVHSDQLRRTIGYLLLLILHRRPSEEHTGLITILDERMLGMEVATMAEAMTGTISEQAYERGMEQGIEQGETRGKRAAIFKLLQRKFDSVPEALKTQIDETASSAELDVLFDRIFDATTLDDIHSFVSTKKN